MGIIGYIKIQKPVIVIICPGGTETIPPAAYPRFTGNIGKSTITVILVQQILCPIAGAHIVDQIKVQKPIVVVISPGNINACAVVIYTSTACNVRESSVSIIFIKDIHIVVIGNVYIQKSIVIVVTPGCAHSAGIIADVRRTGNLGK